jgi:hypothetical protein
VASDHERSTAKETRWERWLCKVEVADREEADKEEAEDKGGPVAAAA